MLDVDTKRRIDTARDILVGKVPDPKSQVEQITIALIYKFMDDMDAQSEELGGERRFFAGEFARYGWARLTGPSVGGHEMLNLYAEAITRMPENPGIPPLFRDIFNNAYLPYRDPETLRAFLKIIDEFTYDHSERLGDAFEYLLSVLGAQGDAGQFRTPRHIIDFIVAVVDPKKDETVLDPACGTAGFLISAYKHILAANTSSDGRSALTPDDRGRLVNNFRGYDISPDMVRLSLVNMYLHGFREPRIHEYDTLTSDERWNEYADVILANPPFMSPRGGIKPHTRFAVQSKRSEVLFVDYMAEHLTTSGRAGIIVPEGIIFQSQKAYRQLRKMLVEDYLVAVVSLPAGVFNPYSGVKTSILLLDSALAKRIDHIAFFKVENDGFDLGAQRRPLERNDLPRVQGELGDYLCRLRAGETVDDFRFSLGMLVEKKRIATDGEYNLSGERFRVDLHHTSEWPIATLADIFESIRNGFNVRQKDQRGRFRVTRIQTIANGVVDLSKTKWTDDDVPKGRFMQAGDILFSHINSEPHLAKTAIFPECETPVVHGINLLRLRPRGEFIEPLFALYILKSDYFVQKARSLAQRAVNQASINVSSLRRITIPLPPLEAQREIVTEIKGYQKVIDGARAVLENYRPHIAVDPEWPLVALSEHFTTVSGGTPSKKNSAFWGGTIPWVSPKDMKEARIANTEDYITEAAIHASSTKLIPVGSLVCVVRSGILKHSLPIAILDRDMCINQDIVALKPTTGELLPQFLLYLLKAQAATILRHGVKTGATVQSIHKGFFSTYHVPLPALETQQAFVAQIETEQALVDANRELIWRSERKIQAAVSRIWQNEASIAADM